MLYASVTGAFNAPTASPVALLSAPKNAPVPGSPPLTAEPIAPVPVLAIILVSTGFAPLAIKTDFAELDNALRPVLSAIFSSTVNGLAPFATDTEPETNALDMYGAIVLGTPSATKAEVNPFAAPAVRPPITAPITMPLSGSVPRIRAFTPPIPPPYNAPVPAAFAMALSADVAPELSPPTVVPAVPAAEPVVESPAKTSPASAPAPVIPPPPTSAPTSPAATSGSKSIDPMESAVSAIAPTINQPPGITSFTPLSICAPMLPIAGPGSICANTLPTSLAALL